MNPTRNTRKVDAFVSYASRDMDRVAPIVARLESAGVSVWRDQERILGGGNYGPEIVDGIERCNVLLLMCSAASMRSQNVKQEIQLAWHYGRPYLPLLLDGTIGRSYPKQVQYWLEGCQWIEVLDRPPHEWLPMVLQAIERIGAGDETADPGGLETASAVCPVRLDQGLEGLRKLASFTDQIWPEPAAAHKRGHTRGALRDLGELPEEAGHGFRLGSRVCLAIESDREGHLLLLNEGTSGKIYCLCPSRFAPDTQLHAGRTYLPQAGPPLDAFAVTGRPGREQLLAIVTDQPLDLGWMPNDPAVPARVLTPPDVEHLLSRVRALEADRWTALSTYFDVMA